MSFAHNMSCSSQAFRCVVWPIIQHEQWLGPGDFELVEDQSDYLRRSFDILAGIDLWHIDTARGMRGIASRIQWGCNFQTFTIRYSTASGARTEFQKRLEAIENPDEGWAFPIFTVQAYISGGRGSSEVASVAIVPTRQLIEYARDNIMNLTIQSNSEDGNQFLVVPWTRLPGVQIWERPRN